MIEKKENKTNNIDIYLKTVPLPKFIVYSKVENTKYNDKKKVLILIEFFWQQ